jgi:hypothetical protein
MLGLEQLSPEDRNVVVRTRRLERFLTQPFFTTEQFTGLSQRPMTPVTKSIPGSHPCRSCATRITITRRRRVTAIKRFWRRDMSTGLSTSRVRSRKNRRGGRTGGSHRYRHFKGGAADKVAGKLLTQGLIEETPARRAADLAPRRNQWTLRAAHHRPRCNSRGGQFPAR